MPNNLTDKEIKKALETLEKLDFFYGQRAGRELWNKKPVDVQNKDIKNFSKDIEFLKDLINRQEAENESLKAEVERLKANEEMAEGYADALVEYTKAEAYKECIEKAVERVEKVRQKYQRLCKEQGEEMDEAMNIHFNGMINLLNELAG